MTQFLKLRGLPFSASLKDVMEFLNGMPVLDESAISLTYNDEGRPSGEAIIRLCSPINADIISAYNGRYVGSRFIEVFPSTQRDFVTSETRKSSNESTILRVRGLPYDVTKDDVYNFFTGLLIARDGVGILMGPDGSPTGEAFIQFMTKEDANMAQQRHNQVIRSRYIEVFRSSMMDAAKTFERQYQVNREYLVQNYQNNQPFMRPNQFVLPFGNNGGYQDNYYSNQNSNAGPMRRGTQTSGYKKLKATPYGRRGRLRNEKLVFMRGLPYTAVDKDVQDFFAPLNVDRVTLLKNPDGKATGEAEAEFLTEEDANEAMKKDRCKMSWRYIELFHGNAP